MRKLLVLLFTVISFAAFAKDHEKKVVTPDDFAVWKRIKGKQISNNGKLAIWEENAQRGDGQLVLRFLNSKQTDTISRAYSAKISPESDFIVYKIKQPFETIRQAKIKKVKKDKMPQDSLGIYVLNPQRISTFAKIKSYALPEENAQWLAFLVKEIKKKAEEPKDSSIVEKKDDTKKGKKKKSDQLVVYNIQTGDTICFSNVTGYQYAKKGASIAFIQEFEDSLKHTKVSVFNTEKAEVETVFQDTGVCKCITMDEQGSQFAFLFSDDTTKVKVFNLYFGDTKNGLSNESISEKTEGMPINWAVSEHGKLSFSEDGKKLYFGTAPCPEEEITDSIPNEEKVTVDVWNWKDKALQPEQKLNLKKEKKRSYLAVFHIADHKFVQLADYTIRQVRTTQEGNGILALGKDDLKYKREFSWTGKELKDYYLINTQTGEKQLFVKGIQSAWLSPQGRFVIWYNPADSCYYSKLTDGSDKKVHQLTKHIPVIFCNELHDMPSDPRPYGIAGWGENDRCVYIYDRYDIWEIDPTESKVPVNVTHGYGRNNLLQLRYVKLDKDDKFIDSKKVNILRSFDEKTKGSGFLSADFKRYTSPRLLIAESKYFERPIKAKDEDRLLFTKETCAEFPDLWVSNLKFDNSRKISDANPQQKNYNWVFSKLIKWTSFTGEELEGILYLPENFDLNKKYPMIVYFYERNTQNLFRYSTPSPSRSIINKSQYASDGYIVFVPDITYKSGYPGQSAYDAIVSGTDFLINTFSCIDKTKIGLQGQSWGGYQTAYLITQTNMYAAAMAGAPVSNMTSAYGGIRWGSGLSRMFQYEHSQSRIGGTLWNKTMQYIENSPLFFAPKVETPLLMMHNDNDGAVPWYQGIEYFVALRRLNKPVWLLSYCNEPHNLKAESWGNRMDLTIRMKAFFDHYLKGAPIPEWMEYGIPAKDKGKKLGY